MTNQEIVEKLKQLSDEEYKKFHSKLCPNTDNILGVRVPILRNFAKEIVKDDWKSYLDNAEDNYYEETMLQGMVIGLAKMSLQQWYYYVQRWIPKIDNWAVCDVCVSGFKIVKKNQEEVWKWLQQYQNANEEFVLRFYVIMLLDFYIQNEYIDEVLEKINHIQHEGYYVKMAVAWLISIAFIKFPEKTKKFLNNNLLDDFTYNKSLQKMLESYRIDEETKKWIRNMKRK